MRNVSRSVKLPNLGSTIRVAFLTLMFVFLFVPILWMVNTSIKYNREITASEPTLIPHDPTLSNFRAVFGLTEDSGTGRTGERSREAFVNSVVVSSVSTLFVLLLATPASYAMGRYKVFGSKVVARNILFARVLPPAAIAIPIFRMFSDLGITDTWESLIIIYTATALPFAIWMLTSFVAELPREIEEAAEVDGASILQVLVQIVTPLLAPSLMATAVITFVLTWNEFFFALVLTRFHAQTFPVQISGYIGTAGIQWGEMSAIGIMGLIPPVLVLIFAQRYLVRGLTMGALK